MRYEGFWNRRERGIIKNMLNIIRIIKKLWDRYLAKIDMRILIFAILSIYLIYLYMSYFLHILTYCIKVFLVLVQH